MKTKQVSFEISTRQAEALLSFLRRTLHEGAKTSANPVEALIVESGIRIAIRALRHSGLKDRAGLRPGTL